MSSSKHFDWELVRVLNPKAWEEEQKQREEFAQWVQSYLPKKDEGEDSDV